MVALTVTTAVIRLQRPSGAPDPALRQGGGSALALIVLAGLVGATAWNLLTWLPGLASSSSHAPFGGLIGSAVAGLGWGAVDRVGDGTTIDGVVAGVGTRLVHRVVRGVTDRCTDRGFRWGRVGSASLVSPAHGTDDAQKTMGVITPALIASGRWSSTDPVPSWVEALCALAIAAGTHLGGWRIIRAPGEGLVEIAPPQGLTEQEVHGIARELAAGHLAGQDTTADDVERLVHEATLGTPSAEDVARVSSHLAAGGWPLADPDRAQPPDHPTARDRPRPLSVAGATLRS